MINGEACQLSLLRNGIQILEEYQQFVFFTFLFFLPFTKEGNLRTKSEENQPPPPTFMHQQTNTNCLGLVKGKIQN